MDTFGFEKATKGLLVSKTIVGGLLTVPSVVLAVLDLVQSPEVATAVTAVGGTVGVVLVALGRLKKGIKDIRGLF